MSSSSEGPVGDNDSDEAEVVSHYQDDIREFPEDVDEGEGEDLMENMEKCVQALLRVLKRLWY
jgi:hypothetical protein